MADWKLPANHPTLNLESSNLPEWELRTFMQLSTIPIGEGLFASTLLKTDTMPQNPDPIAIANARNFWYLLCTYLTPRLSST